MFNVGVAHVSLVLANVGPARRTEPLRYAS
jgi:hypothetical protein